MILFNGGSKFQPRSGMCHISEVQLVTSRLTRAGDIVGCKHSWGGGAQGDGLHQAAAQQAGLEPQHQALPVWPGCRPHHACPGHT